MVFKPSFKGFKNKKKYFIQAILKIEERNNFCPKLSAFAPKCVFYSPLIVCICPKSCVFAPNFLSLNFPLIVCICPKSCESSPNQALHTPNIKKKKFGAKTHDLGGI